MPRKNRLSNRKSRQHCGGQRYKKRTKKPKEASLENTTNDNHDINLSMYHNTSHYNVNDHDSDSSSTPQFTNNLNIITQEEDTVMYSSRNSTERQPTWSELYPLQLETIDLGTALNAHRSLPSLPNKMKSDYSQTFNNSIITNSNTNNHSMRNRSSVHDQTSPLRASRVSVATRIRMERMKKVLLQCKKESVFY